MLGRNSFRMLPPGPKGPLRLMAEGGLFSGVKRGLNIIGEQLPQWWGSDETADLRKGLRQTGLGALYTFGPGLPMLPMVGAEIYDQFVREPEQWRDAPTPGSFSWLEKKLGRDLHDPREETFAMASGAAQAVPLVKAVPKVYRGIKAAPTVIPKMVEKTSDFIAEKFPSTASQSSPAMKKFLEL